MNKRLNALLISSSLSCICLGSIQANAQVQVGSATHSKGPGKISAEAMARFKQSTTYFVLQEKDYAQEAIFRAAIAKIWQVTPFKIIRPEEMGQLDQQQSSFFFFGGFVTVRQGRSTVTYHPHLSYDLFLLSTNKKGHTEQDMLGKILLHLDGASYQYVTRYANGNNKNFSKQVIPFLYQEAAMQNWTPQMLSGYLKVINDGLASGTLRSVFDEYTDEEGIKALKHQTLYIPDYVNTKFNMFTGTEKETESDEGEDNTAYAFGNKYLAAKEIAHTAAAQNKAYAYLSYIKSSTDKFVSVFDGETGKLLYTAYTPVAYNFKSKDLKRIAAKVK
ncbi:MAG: hypothetical protein EOP54_02795 [Sphingobacteriales bacterium]|nr:MAG: hypothetical protein EOP54_02795 [Sphingobacteriales bacterium]